MLLKKVFNGWKTESLLFIGAGAGEKKKPGAGQKGSGSATLL